MLALRRILESVEKGLETLTQRTKDMQRLLDNLEEALTAEQPKKRPTVKARPGKKRLGKEPTVVRKKAKGTATEAVRNVIIGSRKGVSTAQIRAKTGLEEKKIWDIINRLKRQGTVKSAGRGRYMKA